MPTDDDLLGQVAKAKTDEEVRKYIEGFENYGHLIESMSPLELAAEIGRTFSGKQAAIVVILLKRILVLESERHGEESHFEE